MDAIINFVVADDQVSRSNLYSYHALTCPKSIRVTECPEFRDLCSILRESLLERDIPRRDKLREAIIKRWHRSFKDLKLELSVCSRTLSSQAFN
jgi:hypothetical protein